MCVSTEANEMRKRVVTTSGKRSRAAELGVGAESSGGGVLDHAVGIARRQHVQRDHQAAAQIPVHIFVPLVLKEAGYVRE